MRGPRSSGWQTSIVGCPTSSASAAAEHGAQRVVDAQEASVQPDHGHAVGRMGERRLEHRADLAVRGLGRPPLAEILRPRHPVQRPAVAVDGGDRLGLGGKHAAVQAHVLGSDPEVTLATEPPRRGRATLSCHAGRQDVRSGPPDEVIGASAVHRCERGVDRLDEPRRCVGDGDPARAPPERLLPVATQLVRVRRRPGQGTRSAAVSHGQTAAAGHVTHAPIGAHRP